MNKLMFFSVLIFSGLFSNSQNCSPTYKEIYNFQSGDVFQFVSKDYTDAGGAGLTVTTTTKYSVTGVLENNDTLSYFVSIIENVAYSCNRNEIDICETPTEYKSFKDTLLYIDSATHFLNGCDQQVVPNFFSGSKSWLNDIEGGPFYTIIQTSVNDGIHLKTVGGSNIYTYQADSLVHFGNEAFFTAYKEIYGGGLGRIDFRFSQARYDYHKYLEGYVKNGATTGIVTSDNDLLVSSPNALIANEITVFPNPCTGLLYIKSGRQLSDMKTEIFDGRGIMVLSQKIADHSLDLSFLKNGIYFIRLTDDNGKTTTKTIVKN